MTATSDVTVLNEWADGGRRVEVMGVRVSMNRLGGVIALSDWSRAGELVAAGYLRRDGWYGNGMFGHDTYTFAGDAPCGT